MLYGIRKVCNCLVYSRLMLYSHFELTLHDKRGSQMYRVYPFSRNKEDVYMSIWPYLLTYTLWVLYQRQYLDHWPDLLSLIPDYSFLCVSLSSPPSFLSSCFVGHLSGVCVWQRPPSAAPPAPSRSWEVTQFPMIQCGCFCCVVAVAILRGPLMPTVTAPWIMDRESDSVLDREREGWVARGRGGTER